MDQSREEKWRSAARAYRQLARDEFYRKLKEFLESPEGLAGMQLLEASAQCIVFAQKELDGVPTHVWFLNLDGLRYWEGVPGGWIGGGRRNTHPTLEIEEAVRVLMSLDTQSYKLDIVGDFRKKLDEIANGAPSDEE